MISNGEGLAPGELPSGTDSGESDASSGTFVVARRPACKHISTKVKQTSPYDIKRSACVLTPYSGHHFPPGRIIHKSLTVVRRR